MKTLKLSKYTLAAVLSTSMLTSIAAVPPAAVIQGQNGSSINRSIPNASMWTSMGQSFGLKSAADNPRVQQQIAGLVKNQASLYKMLQQAGPMISYVYQQVKKRGLPTELALLPVVESGFNPHAKSGVGASGLWQLMPKTAIGLGVKTNSAYDGRKDIIASTAAAMNYLVSLGQTFNRDWYLALAAYNWGPGNVRKAVKQQTQWFKRSNYWVLKMPAETKNYVPKLLALVEIIKNPARYGVTLPTIGNGPQLAVLRVAGNVDFKKITDSTSISMDTMRKLNPGYTKSATTSGAPNTLLVPLDKAAEVHPVVAVLASSVADSDSSPLVKLADNSSSADADDASGSSTDQAQAGNEDTSHKVHLVKAMLKEGKWLLFALANIPGSDSIAA
jgi:membrane-bound lytic murein transglycosylase D